MDIRARLVRLSTLSLLLVLLLIPQSGPSPTAHAGNRDARPGIAEGVQLHIDNITIKQGYYMSTDIPVQLVTFRIINKTNSYKLLNIYGAYKLSYMTDKGKEFRVVKSLIFKGELLPGKSQYWFGFISFPYIDGWLNKCTISVDSVEVERKG